MAGQKRAGSASARAKGGGAVTRSGSAGSGRGSQATQSAQSRTTSTGAARAGKPGQASDQGGRRSDGTGQGSRGRASRVPGARVQDGRQASSQARSAAGMAEPLADRAAARPLAPRWFQLATLALSLAGLGVSIYLTIVHYGSSNLLVCSASGTVNCEKVISSPESMVFGVFPVAVLGLAFYVFMVAINTPWAWRSQLPLIWWARLGGIITGMGFVLYLLYAELVQIGNICLWCTSVHVLTFVLFVLLIFYYTLGTGGTAKTRTATTRAR